MDRIKAHNAVAATVEMYAAALAEAQLEIDQLRVALDQAKQEVQRLHEARAELTQQALTGVDSMSPNGTQAVREMNESVRRAALLGSKVMR